MAAPKGNNYSALRKTHPTYTDDEIAKICDDLLEWAHTDDGLFLDSYVYETYKRPSSWLYDLGAHHPEVKEALDTYKRLIGGKVARHCWIGDRNSSFGEKILPMYSQDYKAETVRKAELSKPSLSKDDIAQVIEVVDYKNSLKKP